LIFPHCGQAQRNDFKLFKLVNPGNCWGLDAIWRSPLSPLARLDCSFLEWVVTLIFYSSMPDMLLFSPVRASQTK
jgi:hypothetical protein